MKANHHDPGKQEKMRRKDDVVSLKVNSSYYQTRSDLLDQHGPPTPTDGDGWFTCPVVLLEQQEEKLELLKWVTEVTEVSQQLDSV